MNPHSPAPETIDDYADLIPPFVDAPDFELDPLLPTVEDALVLPRTTPAADIQIPAPDALPLMSSSRPRPLHSLLDTIRNPVQTARLRWHIARYDQHASAANWPAAFDILEKISTILPQNAETPEDTAAIWLSWLFALTQAAIRADLFTDFAPLFERYSSLAFPANTPPFALATAFSDITHTDQRTAAIQFAELLAGRFPDSALGFYLLADFSERASAHVRSRSTVETNAIVQNYQAAIRLLQNQQRSNAASITRLRLGAFLLTTGTDRHAGRKLLKTIAPDTLAANDALWYARAMLHSPFWIDRVRSADILDTLAESTQQARPGTAQIDIEAIRITARTLLHASSFELQPAEHDRLTSLAQNLFSGPETAEWHQLLELRPTLEKLHTQPLDQAKPAFDLLNRLARAQSTAVPTQSPWQDTFHSFARLQSAFVPRQTHSSTTLQRPGDTHRYRFSELTGDLLDLLTPPIHTPNAIELLRTLHTTLRRLNDSDDPMELKPIALLWPRILPHIAQLPPVTRDHLEDTASLWITRTPDISYGFWLLAAHFLHANLISAARSAATRALSDASPAPYALRRHVIGHLTQHAIQERNPTTMLLWLTHLKNLEAPTEA